LSGVWYPRVSCFSFDILHMLNMRSSVDIKQYANGVSNNMTASDTEFFVPWHRISIFRENILTFPMDTINFARTHIVLSSVTVTVLPLTPCLNVCLCVLWRKCLHVDWFAVNCRNAILLVLVCVFVVYLYRIRKHRTLPET